MLGCQCLGFIAVMEIQIGLCDFSGFALVYDLINERDRVFCQNADAWVDDLKLISTDLIQNEGDLTFKSQQHIPDAPLYKCGCGATTATIENGYVLEEFADELLCFFL